MLEDVESERVYRLPPPGQLVQVRGHAVADGLSALLSTRLEAIGGQPGLRAILERVATAPWVTAQVAPASEEAIQSWCEADSSVAILIPAAEGLRAYLRRVGFARELAMSVRRCELRLTDER